MERKSLYRGVRVINRNAIGKLNAKNPCTIVVADDYKITLQILIGNNQQKFWLYLEEFKRDFVLDQYNFKSFKFPQDTFSADRNALKYKPSDNEQHAIYHLYSSLLLFPIKFS